CAEGAALTLLHVLDAPARGADSRPMDALEWDIQRTEAHRYLTRLVDRLQTPELRVEDHLAEGAAHERVASVAADLGASMLVLATRGDGEAACRIGGTAHKILELAPCPVLTMPAREGEPIAAGPLRRIFVPLDGSMRSQHVLPTVLRLARALKTQIVLATAIREPERTELLSREEDLRLAQELTKRMVRQAEEYLARIRRQLEAGGVTAVTRVQRGPDHRAVLVEMARAEDADLTVMSAHGSNCDPRRRFGTLPSQFMAHSSCPLMVLQDLPGRPKRVARWDASRLPSRAFDAVAGGA
ncbi:MAG TPA: universal stress protein, partial [Longimicrobiales bacterium]|nr:universal stress protein [Longimicrobiales bacterium]